LALPEFFQRGTQVVGLSAAPGVTLSHPAAEQIPYDIAHAVSRRRVLLSMQSRTTAFRPKQLVRQPGGCEGFITD
jgi:monoamine oxidase